MKVTTEFCSYTMLNELYSKKELLMTSWQWAMWNHSLYWKPHIMNIL